MLNIQLCMKNDHQNCKTSPILIKNNLFNEGIANKIEKVEFPLVRVSLKGVRFATLRLGVRYNRNQQLLQSFSNDFFTVSTTRKSKHVKKWSYCLIIFVHHLSCPKFVPLRLLTEMCCSCVGWVIKNIKSCLKQSISPPCKLQSCNTG